MSASDQTRRRLDAVWRLESGRLIAGLTRMVHDVGLAEELAQDAMVSALEQWPADGVPQNPGAWLMTTAKRRAIDRFRRQETFDRKLRELGHSAPLAFEPEIDVEDIPDDVLRLMFLTCHPVLPTPSRVALTLRLLGGLTTGEIARAFLSAEATIAQRIVRAKRTLAAENVPFELPSKQHLGDRLGAVLEVLYLVFNEGYSATHGADWTRPELCNDALRLGRLLAGLAPAEPEVHGLVALMEIQASRMKARSDADGNAVLLMDQDRTKWDRLLIRRGLEALQHAEHGNGPYVLQARIAACHARAYRPEDTDWPRIAELYGHLAQAQKSPIVQLNRAVAVAMAGDPAAGLKIIDTLTDEPSLARSHLLPSARGELLARSGRPQEAAGEFRRAADLTHNAAERAVLRGKAETALSQR